MARYEFRGPRLYVDQPLKIGGAVTLDRAQAHYLADVLRLKAGETVLLFNGFDGEWRTVIAAEHKRATVLDLKEQVRPQTDAPDIHYLFAPLKRARLDYMVQKAVEMGVSKLQPVMTRFTQSERVNTERMRANVIEAAEQCGILAIPEVAEPMPLVRALENIASSRILVFCDEDATAGDPIEALSAMKPASSVAVLIGPEGGFAEEEREALLSRPACVRLSLGPRILRADTAAVAALALVQAVLGDWGSMDRNSPV